MPVKIDKTTRRRMAANLWRLMESRDIANAPALAKRLQVHVSAAYRYLDGTRTIGLDVALKIHRLFNVSLDWLVDEEPAQTYYDKLDEIAPAEPRIPMAAEPVAPGPPLPRPKRLRRGPSGASHAGQRGKHHPGGHQ